jgi:hypothetical protein
VLFSSEAPGTGSSVPDSTPADQSARKPRVLRIISPPAIRVEEVKAPVSPEPRTAPAIPRSQLARLRSWVKYGMTIAQVAQVYRVPVGEIEHILRHA